MTKANFDLKLLVSVLDKHGVDYVVVGGIGAMAYGANRQTQDLDCVVERSIDNLKKLRYSIGRVARHSKTARRSGLRSE